MLNRRDDYVDYKTAKLLKEKGFINDWCVAYYEIPLTYTTTYHPLKFVDEIKCDNINFNSWLCAAPTLQMAMRWLREKHGIFIEVAIYSTAKPVLYRWNAYKNGRLVSDEEEPKCTEYVAKKDLSNLAIYYYKYEDACRVAIKYCLENLIEC